MKLKVKIVSTTNNGIKQELPVTQCPPGLYPWSGAYFLVLETTDADTGAANTRAYLFISSTGEAWVCKSPTQIVNLNERIENFSLTITS